VHTREAPPAPVDVLIAEDDTLLRGSMRRLFEQEGYTCAEAGDGREAVELARNCPPRCVLLDLELPGLDGFAVARQLRADPRTRGARIHCLTGKRDADSRRQAHRAGCELYLTKPVDPATLLRAVHQGVGRSPTQLAAGLTKAQAEDLLDWLQATGRGPGEVSYEDGDGFSVRWTEPAD
jgi:CheY-like chemotaxis protein